MQEIKMVKKPSQLIYHDAKIGNHTIQSQLYQIDSILKRLQSREHGLSIQLVYAVKHNLPSAIIYAKELQIIGAFRAKIHNFQQLMKSMNASQVITRGRIG